MLPAAKVTPEIAAARGIETGRDCRSPSRHSAFSDVDSLLDFVETIAERTGLPVGIKSAVSSVTFWDRLAESMGGTGRGVDFITVDGGEGGTGDAPLAFSDHVSLPFKLAISRVYRAFAERGLTDDVVFIGSGRLGMPETALLAMALGCDMINVAREANAGYRLHPGATLPHRALPGRDHHPLRLAHPRARPRPQISAPSQLHLDAPP